MYAHEPRDQDETYGGSQAGYGDYSKQGGRNEFEYPVNYRKDETAEVES